MTSLTYVVAGLRHRRAETVAAAVTLGLLIAFLASLGSFVTQSRDRLTVRAAASVPVDWQVQVSAGTDPQTALTALSTVPDVLGIRAVDYARIPGLRSTGAGGTRTTGPGFLVAVPGDYAGFAPRELRPQLGATTGILLQQQTAANLAAGPGSSVQVVGSRVAPVTVQGVVDLPAADSFFQVVGAPAGSGASAPPDNVLLVPPDVFRSLTGGLPVVHQLHVRFRHDRLPSDPAAASDLSTRRANHYASTVAGGAIVGNQLGAALLGAREDAVYASLLVLLLGLPGVVLAAVIAYLVVALRTDRQRRDLALLRLRGASPARTVLLVTGTAALDGILGSALGLGGALLATRLALGQTARLSPGWLLSGVVVGLLIAVVTQVGPVLRATRESAPSIRADVSSSAVTRLPLPLRLGLDGVCLVGSALVFWLSSRSGYQVVVVPEGVPVASVNYAALLAPALAWPGLALLVWRLTSAGLSWPRPVPGADPDGRLPDVRAAVVRRRRRLVARGATGLALAIGISLSTAVFTATYDRQARVDVALTVGSDVAVTLPPDTRDRTVDASLARLPGVLAVERMQHRLAYVGPDLQDLYGIDARTIGRAAPLQDAFTPGSSVRTALARLASTEDGALLAQETLHDYQLRPGDLVRLRLQDGLGRYRTVPFHVAGVVTEFATAPRDSFIVANASYVARVTGSAAMQTLLVRTDQPGRIAAVLRRRVPSGMTVADTVSAAAVVASASGLAAGNLTGLARLTLGFGFPLAVASGVLALVVGAAQRRRMLTILTLIGATSLQRRRFLRSEATALLAAGLLGGLVAGFVVAAELVKVLHGIFDPPPEHATVPLGLLGALVVVVLGGGAATVAVAGRLLSRVDASALRDL